MDTKFARSTTRSNVFFIATCSVIQTVGDEFCRITGYTKKEILNKTVSEVMRRLLRTPENMVRKLENGETTDCILFTKTLQVKEVEFTVTEVGESICYFAEEKHPVKMVDDFGVVGKLLHDNVRGVGVFSVPELILLKANERFLSLLDEPFQKPEIGLGKTISELIPWSTFGQAKDSGMSSILLGKTYYGKEIKGRTGRWLDRYCDNTIIPIMANGSVKYLVCIVEDVTEAVLIRQKSEGLARTVSYQNEILKEKNALLAAVVDNMTDGIVIFDKDKNYLMMNRAAKELYDIGDEPLQKIGDMRRAARLLDEKGELMEAEQYASSRLLRGETVQGIPITVETAEKTSYTEVGGVPICDDKGQFLAGFICIRNITEQKKKEQLAAAMEKIREFMHSTLRFEVLMNKVLIEAAKAVDSESAAIWLRQDGKWQVTNSYGFSANIIGITLDDKLEPHSLLAIKTKRPVIVEDAFHDKRVNLRHMKNWNIRAVIVIPLLAGEEPLGVMHFNFHKSAMRFSSALVEFVVNLGISLAMEMQNVRLYEKVCCELSIQERLKEELQNEKNHMEAVIENMSDALFIFDMAGNYTKLNKTARDYHLPFFKKMPRVGGGHQAVCFVDSDGKVIPPEKTPVRRVMRGEKLVGYKMIIQTPDKQIYTDVSGTPIYDERGNMVAGILCSRDETEHVKKDALLEKQNEQLEEALKMKDELLTMLSHEFKTPITVVNAALQAMENLYQDEISDNAKRLLKIIKQNQFRQLRLVNNLLEVARMHAGQAKVNLKNCDIVGLTRTIVESVQLYAKQKEVILSFSAVAARKIIGLDEEKYEKILLNLLSNAIKFTRAGGRISVRVTLQKDAVKIDVKDEGIGIVKEKLQVIFERFEQADSLLSRRAEGTGIGLNIVKFYTEALGGRITVKSKLKKGSVFTVTLPDEIVMENTEQEAADATDNHLERSTAIELSDLYLM